MNFAQVLSNLPDPTPVKPVCKTCDDTKTVAVHTCSRGCSCALNENCWLCRGRGFYESTEIKSCPKCTPEPQTVRFTL